MTTDIATRPPNSNYTDAEVELGLRTLAMVSGNDRRAAELVQIPRSTLQGWKAANLERYQRIQEDVMPAVYAEMAEQAEDIATRAAQLEGKIVTRISNEVDEIPAEKLPNALVHVSTSKGINQDKSLLLRGRPTSITATADVTELLKGLSSRLGIGSAPPAQTSGSANGDTRPVNAHESSSGTSEPKP